MKRNTLRRWSCSRGRWAHLSQNRRLNKSRDIVALKVHYIVCYVHMLKVIAGSAHILCASNSNDSISPCNNAGCIPSSLLFFPNANKLSGSDSGTTWSLFSVQISASLTRRGNTNTISHFNLTRVHNNPPVQLRLHSFKRAQNDNLFGRDAFYVMQCCRYMVLL